ncbi:excinuclease ABC subunit UvrC [candidate division TA06 bacterium]|uniref:UvrABC system protein C n=1 Tax=candidate division TA06 bacterium TaxID=2250710 RepID=A0A933IDK8_UNCT6|nr:excinuclease ABC subunit UvrC [candidate division TA06 bacterium]
MSNILSKIQNFPQQPGVYLFKDAAGGLIYIGKAKGIKDRVLDHLRNNIDPKEMRMVSLTTDIDYILTDSEIEALILEAQLVKKHQPKYNINLKDDKKFPWIKVTRETFPQIYSTRNLSDDGSKLFGPYIDATAVKRTLKLLKTIFPLRSCSRQLPDKGPSRPCLNYHIGKCYGPCQGYISEQEYQAMIRSAVGFLTGRSKELERKLKRLRDESAQKLDFEAAARWRDHLQNLQKVTAHQKTILPDEADCDVMAMGRLKAQAFVTVLQFREGRLVARLDRALDNPLELEESKLWPGFMEQHYLRVLTIPQKILLDILPEDHNLLEEWLSRLKNQKVTIVRPATTLEKKFLNLAQKQIGFKLDEMVAQKEELNSKTVKPLLELQQALGLPALPRSITAFDISHISGTDAVGSAVSFKDGRPFKSGYRKFKIKAVEGVNDPAMMRETIERYWENQEEKNEPHPDFLLVDGGLPQLNAALHLAGEKGYNVMVAGLAKRLEEIYLTGGEVVSLARNSSALHLLQRLRDESHRFAQSYHHKLRQKGIDSELNKIPGIGAQKSKLLLKTFGSLKRIRETDPERLSEILGSKTAAKVIEYLQKENL